MSSFHEVPAADRERTPAERIADLFDIALIAENTASVSLTLRAQKYIGAVYRLTSLAKEIVMLPSVGDIDTVDVSAGWRVEEDAVLHITLKRQDSAILREMVQAGITRRITKSVAYDAKSLSAEFMRERIRVEVRNYKPESCTIVEEEIEKKLEDARVDEHGNVYVLTKVTRVVCNPAEGDETPDSPPPARNADEVPF